MQFAWNKDAGMHIYLGENPKEVEEVYKLFPSIGKRGVANALLRLVNKGRIQSVWKGFYVIIPVEYAQKGIIPPIVYINQLMAI